MQEQKIFHKDLTLTNSLFFMDNLALRVKKNLLSKLSDSQIELKKQIEFMHDKKIGNRSLLLHPDIFFWIKSQEKKSLEIILKSVLNNFETLQNNKNSLGFFISINYLNKNFNSNRLAKAQRAACEAELLLCELRAVRRSATEGQAGAQLGEALCPSAHRATHRFDLRI